MRWSFLSAFRTTRRRWIYCGIKIKDALPIRQPMITFSAISLLVEMKNRLQFVVAHFPPTTATDSFLSIDVLHTIEEKRASARFISCWQEIFQIGIHALHEAHRECDVAQGLLCNCFCSRQCKTIKRGDEKGFTALSQVLINFRCSICRFFIVTRVDTLKSTNRELFHCALCIHVCKERKSNFKNANKFLPVHADFPRRKTKSPLYPFKSLMLAIWNSMRVSSFVGLIVAQMVTIVDRVLECGRSLNVLDACHHAAKIFKILFIDVFV